MSAPSIPNCRTRGHFPLGPFKSLVRRASSQLDCCLCSGKISRMHKAGPATLSSHTKDRSGGSPCLLQPLCLELSQVDQGWDLSEAWNSASSGEITLNESCVFILVSFKKIKAQKRISFDLLLFALAVTKRDKATTCWQALTTFNCWKSDCEWLEVIGKYLMKLFRPVTFPVRANQECQSNIYWSWTTNEVTYQNVFNHNFNCFIPKELLSTLKGVEVFSVSLLRSHFHLLHSSPTSQSQYAIQDTKY